MEKNKAQTYIIELACLDLKAKFCMARIKIGTDVIENQKQLDKILKRVKEINKISKGA